MILKYYCNLYLEELKNDVGGKNMKRKIIVVLICIVLTIPILTNCAIAEGKEDPEIIDDSFQIWDLTSGLNIISAWFENDDTNLYVSIKMASIKPKLFLAVSVLWSYNNVDYYASFQNNIYYFGYNTNGYLPWRMNDTSGNLYLENNIIKITVPLNEIGNPAKGEKLHSTWAMTHWSGFLGLNFHCPLDRAPNWGKLGKDYFIV